MVVPSGIAQAFPGRSHLAIPGQIGPSRHHHCPAHFAAEPPRVRNAARIFLRSRVCGVESSKERRDRVGPSRTVFGQGWPNAEPTWMYSWRVLDGPTRSRCGLSGEKGLWHPAGSFAPFRGQGPLPLSQDDIGFPDSASLVSFFAILTSPRRPKSGHPVFIEENLCPPRRARVFFWKAFGLPQAGAFNP